MAAVAPADFPVLEARPGLVYLDSAATSQTPRAVLEAMNGYYLEARASVHRGVYPLAAEATARFEGARARIAAFCGSSPQETVFTKNATEALNLVARGVAGPGDVVLLTEMEHHSNLVPWQMTGAELRYVPIDGEGRLAWDPALLDGVDVFAFVHVSNVLGTVNPVADLCAAARERGVITVVDGSQGVPHLPVDVSALGADFYAWTAHKAYGPTGIGILHGRRERLEQLPPLLGGGHMISRVRRFESAYAEPPARFEAGTSNIAEAIGAAAACDFLERVRTDEGDVLSYLVERLREVPGITLHGPSDAACVSFTLEYAHPHDVAEILGRQEVCVRAGHHCAQVLMDVLGVHATSRASVSVHTTREDVDRLVDGLAEVERIFG
jgi:cysteine desulfurase / selenocysteine lyase